MKLRLFWVFIVCISANFAVAQSTKTNNDLDDEFKKAKEFIQQDAYSLAYPIFKKLVSLSNNQSNFPVYIAEESLYYTLVCGLIIDVFISPFNGATHI